MAKLLEYEGKEILKRFKVAVPCGQVARTLNDAETVAGEIGYPVALKAQVYTGKRGKAGGVRFAADGNELRQAVEDLLGARIHGLLVDCLLIEKKATISQELYVGVTADQKLRSPVLIVTAAGGMDVEAVAGESPLAILKFPVDILRGVQVHDTLNLVSQLSCLDSHEKMQVAQVLVTLYEIYRKHDCTLIEVNPLAITPEGPVALDVRIDVDDDSVSRQPDLHLESAEQVGDRCSTLLEQVAGQIDANDHRGTVHFVQIDPDLTYARDHNLIPIGFDCVGAGASLTMMDELVPYGYYPINFCDSSGNPVGSKLYRITKVIFSQPGIQGYVFVSCISSQQLDNTARGIIKALLELYPLSGGQPDIPTVLAFRGAWDEEAIQLLDRTGISRGRWVQVFGRTATEEIIAESFNNLHRDWQRTERGRA
jgi:succinyl-CoA synthetase beta subunit